MNLHSSRVVNIFDLRRLAESRVPRAVFDYIDGGADGELTLRDNCAAFEEIYFRPRQAVPLHGCNMSVEVVGEQFSLPFMLAPVGYSRMMHPGGEVAAARAAGSAGTGYILSTFSGHRLEDVRAATQAPAWYQLHLVGGREVAQGTIERVRKAGFSALVITVDTNVAGMRERDPRNGISEFLTGSLFARAQFLGEIIKHPGWLKDYLVDGGQPKLENVLIPGKGTLPLRDVGAALAQSAVTWEDIEWIRGLWRGPIIIKGLLTGDDARRAIDEGAVAVVVSNHGGRQLDSVLPTIRVLPEIVAAVGGRAEVLMDGGIRRGGDIVKALCLGAKAVLIGRAYTYGLAAGGEAGVAGAIAMLRTDVERTLGLLGCRSVAELDESYVEFPREWKRA